MYNKNVYKALATQYDPNWYIIPYTTRAQSFSNSCGWNGESGTTPYPAVRMDRVGKWALWPDQNPVSMMVWIQSTFLSETKTASYCIFCDTSERGYSSVAYLRIEDEQGGTQVSFVMARSLVATKKQLTIPCLELSAALTGAFNNPYWQNHALVRFHCSLNLATVRVM